MSTQDVNPNSRAAFVDQQGKLTKYGQDTIRALYSAIGLNGADSDVDDLLTSFDVDIATANLRGEMVRLSNSVDEIENDYETATFKSRVSKMEQLMREMESAHDCITKLTARINQITRRIDDIEAQL